MSTNILTCIQIACLAILGAWAIHITVETLRAIAPCGMC